MSQYARSGYLYTRKRLTAAKLYSFYWGCKAKRIQSAIGCTES